MYKQARQAKTSLKSGDKNSLKATRGSQPKDGITDTLSTGTITDVMRHLCLLAHIVRNAGSSGLVAVAGSLIDYCAREVVL